MKINAKNSSLNESLEILDEVKSLITDLKREIETRKQSAQKAVAQEKLLMHHRIGELIKVHLMQNQERAGYGEKIIPLLVTQLGMSQSELYASIQFYESYPQILRSSGELTWTHMRNVLTLKDKTQQKQVIHKIETEELSVVETKMLIKSVKNPDQTSDTAPVSQPLCPPKDRGVPYTYRLEKEAGVLKINLGFGIRIESPVGNITTQSVMTSKKYEQDYRFGYLKDHSSPHYTYKATVLEVIDGDTIWVKIDLGFGVDYTQKLRFKGVNAEELGTQQGEKQHNYVKNALKNCEFIAVKTYWRDKFKRYLADIFYLPGEKTLETVIEKGHFLNAEV